METVSEKFPPIAIEEIRFAPSEWCAAIRKNRSAKEPAMEPGEPQGKLGPLFARLAVCPGLRHLYRDCSGLGCSRFWP